MPGASHTATVEDYLELNRRNWDDRAAAHAASPDYDVAGLVAGRRELSDVVAFDRPRLPDLRGRDVVHLQCHIGTDTLSLARLNAGSTTGLDLSPASLTQARSIAERAGADIMYVESDVYSAPEALDGRTFDVVYTGIGALCWLPSIDRWAHTVSRLLRPGGQLFVREGHPTLSVLDVVDDGRIEMRYPYFESAQPVVSEDGETYVETDQDIPVSRAMDWNHGIGETVMALADHGLRLELLVEHDSVPWNALPGHMIRDERGEWRLREHPERLAASYTLRAHRRAE